MSPVTVSGREVRLNRYGLLCCVLFALSVFTVQGRNAQAADGEIKFSGLEWTNVGEGLELGMAPVLDGGQGDSRFVVLRIDPERHVFALSMASLSGNAHSLAGWSRAEGLRAGINASMYLQDLVTSTGYMRNGRDINNNNMGARLGAFFVANLEKGTGPKADIIERDSPGWHKRLQRYAIVIQNYRFISEQGSVLWREGGALHSIAVVARDRAGRILFILCQEPLTAEGFARRLGSYNLDIGVVMYVEGGAQAGLFLRLDDDPQGNGPVKPLPGAAVRPLPGGVVHVWKGKQSLLKTRGNPDAALPNVLGIVMNKAPS